MIQDNQRYTAMRLFQDIEGADVFYINTYAATTPRLPIFKSICSNAKDFGEDDLQEEDWAELGNIEVPNVKNILAANTKAKWIHNHAATKPTLWSLYEHVLLPI